MVFVYFAFWGLQEEFSTTLHYLNILFFNKLRQIILEIRSERRDLLIFIFILKTTGTFTPVHSAVALSGHKMCIAFLIIAKDCDTCIQVFGQSPVARM
jgi:hypothetical protein